MTLDKTISPDFSYTANFVEVHGAKMHYVDAGSGDPILFFAWKPHLVLFMAYVIPHLVEHGRCVAPDLIGMGRSDKPDIDYRFFDHARYLDGFIEALGLKDITLVIHDWGSGLGFHYAKRHPENVKAIAIMEALLMPTPSWDVFPPEAAELFQAFRTPGVGEELLMQQNVFIEQVLPGSVMRPLSDVEMNAYRAPFLEPEQRKPIWRWPNEIPIAGEPADMVTVVSEYNAWLQKSEIPKLLIYATPGVLITEPLVQWCQGSLKNLEMAHIGEGLHYLQEDRPHELGAALARWVSRL